MILVRDPAVCYLSILLFTWSAYRVGSDRDALLWTLRPPYDWIAEDWWWWDEDEEGAEAIPPPPAVRHDPAVPGRRLYPTQRLDLFRGVAIERRAGHLG